MKTRDNADSIIIIIGNCAHAKILLLQPTDRADPVGTLNEGKTAAENSSTFSLPEYRLGDYYRIKSELNGYDRS